MNDWKHALIEKIFSEMYMPLYERSDCMLIIGIVLFAVSGVCGGIIGYKLSSNSSRNIYYAAKTNELINQSNKNGSA